MKPMATLNPPANLRARQEAVRQSMGAAWEKRWKRGRLTPVKEVQK